MKRKSLPVRLALMALMAAIAFWAIDSGLRAQSGPLMIKLPPGLTRARLTSSSPAPSATATAPFSSSAAKPARPSSGATAKKAASTTSPRPTAPPAMTAAAAGGQNRLDDYLQKKQITHDKRLQAAKNRKAAITAANVTLAAPTLNPLGTPDYFNVPNWAISPLPVLDQVTGTITGGIRKFMDKLPGLGPTNANGLGQFIPVANPDTVTYPGSDYYEINLVQYTEKMHTDLPPTTLRGYVQVNYGTNPAVANPTLTDNTVAPAPVHYLGPLIVARRDRPVRIKFRNTLPTGAGGNLFIPTDTSAMGAGIGPDGVNGYTQNRATLHLHGGHTPWISDGTPHQWTTPAGENTPYPKGVNVSDVPDMPASGPGELTFFYTNQQSARLMFYHDHAYGITRLNVYAGEAAGYLITDNVEQSLITAGVLPDTGTPLIIQDKTFVPDTASNAYFPYPGGQLAAQDPTWDSTHWGGVGNLWYPHVYMPNQNPADSSGADAFGRWDYGPWFWPPINPSTLISQPYPCPTVTSPNQVCPGTPNPSLVPEGFMDSFMVNGTVFPYMQVQPKPYRFRILNASNDRMVNLQLYFADGSGGTGAAATATVTGGVVTAVTLTAGGSGYKFAPAVYFVGGGGSGASATTTITGGVVTAITLSSGGSGYTVAPQVMVGNTKEVKMLPAVPPGAGTPLPACPAGVTTGVSTTFTSGTAYTGTGCWPSTWPTDGRAGGVPDPTTSGPNMIQIGTEGGFLPSPVIRDNTPVGYVYDRRNIVVLNVANTTVMLGPAERADVIVDFSGVPVGSTLVLYNDAPAPVPAFDPRLDYYTGAPDLSSVGGAPFVLPGYAPNTRTIMQIQVVAGTATPFNLGALQTAWPTAYSTQQNAPIVNQTAYGGPADTYVRIQDTSITYTPAGTTTPVTAPLQPKAIQELFELQYGRMNATLGVELPFTNFNTQTTIPLGYKDPLTENLADGAVQFWKITHNGVDTHAIHFHLMDVQVINRVGWDGQIRPPDPNEVGWKDTVRMNPLEDAIVALKPTAPLLSFGVPVSNRPLDPTMPVGSTLSLTDPTTGNAISVVNALTNFGWEYVWHCHLLGHEENDMMRPVAFAVATVAPAAPANVSAITSGTQVVVNWTDPTPAATSLGNPANEIGFRVERSTDSGTTWATAGNARANQTFYTDVFTSNSSTRYRVFAFNASGDSPASAVVTPSAAAPLAFTGITITGNAPATVGAPITWTAITTGGTPPVQFEFWWYDGTTWSLRQPYGTSNIYSYTPVAGDVGKTFKVEVWVKSTGSANAYDAWLDAAVVTVGTTTVTLTSVTANQVGPVALGTPITWTANGTGGAGAQYMFWLNNMTTGTWTLVQNYSSANTYTWIPSASTDVGTFKVEVWARAVSSTAPYDVWMDSATITTVPSAPTITSVTANVGTPVVRGTAITWTCTATGGAAPLQYMFWLHNVTTNTWALAQAYGPSNTFTWTPAATDVGTWHVEVWVNSSGSTASYQAWMDSAWIVVQ